MWLFVFALSLLSLAAYAGLLLRLRWALKENEHEDFAVVRTACLTTLGLLIGFTFSMAISRYDLRNNNEEAEANAIRTAYLRADLLPASQASAVRGHLRNYLDLRIAFFKSRDEDELRRIEEDTVRLQAGLWSGVQPALQTQPPSVAALALAGVNEVLNTKGYTQAAWLNRIPGPAWALVMTMAVCGNLLVGHGERSEKPNPSLLIVLPLVVSIALLLIADIDNPRSGFIHIVPRNLLQLVRELTSVT
jgi:hypothetical protein